MDLGRTWNLILNQNYKAISFTRYENIKVTHTYGIFTNFAQEKWYLLKLDLSKNLGFHFIKIVSKCETSYYAYYTPGENRLSCYKGQRDMFFKKISKYRCQNIYEKLQKPKIEICKCTQEDFNWYLYIFNSQFKMKMIFGECLKENGKKYEFIQPECGIGEIYHGEVM